MKVLRKYLFEESIVLIEEAVLEALTEEQTAYVKRNDGRYANYDFGGEADMWVDMVSTTDHWFLGFLFPDEVEETEQ